MRILGIDPGLNITGYGCVDLLPNSSEPTLVEGGVFRLQAGKSMSFRLAQLHEDLCEVLDSLRPDHIIVEKLYAHYRFVLTAMQMGHARGVVLLAAEMRGIKMSELAPTEIKRAITGHGHATKRQMQLAVMDQCGLQTIPDPPDVADAIAIALCGARRMAMQSI